MNNLTLICLVCGVLIIIGVFIFLVWRILCKNKQALLDFQKAQQINIDNTIKYAINAANEQLLKVNSDRLKEITDNNSNNFSNIVNPFNDNMKTLKDEINKLKDVFIERNTRLDINLNNILEMSNTLSREANDLTQALKGKIKVQGQWGENILKQVLESSGLQSDIHYLEQPSLENEDGNKRIPDYIIKLPKGRQIIIDAKLSLESYVGYCQAKDAQEEQQWLYKISRNFESNLNALVGKKYQQLDTINTIEGVLMFIPIEALYLLLIEKCSQSVKKAFVNKVYITTTTTLLSVIQVIESMWKTHNQNKNALEMARIAGKIYDKFYGIFSDFDKVREDLDKANNHLDDIKSKWKDGRDNVVGNVNKLRKLGAAHTKELPKNWQVLDEDDMLNDVNLQNKELEVKEVESKYSQGEKVE